LKGDGLSPFSAQEQGVKQGEKRAEKGERIKGAVNSKCGVGLGETLGMLKRGGGAVYSTAEGREKGQAFPREREKDEKEPNFLTHH